MANDLVETNRNSIVAAGAALSRAILAPDLSPANGGLPRTILIGRMQAGGRDADLLTAHLLCLPQDEVYGLALFGGPAGPAFKTHPEGMRARFDVVADPGAVGTFLDWRFGLGATPVIASFDPGSAGALEEAVGLFHDHFELPIDVIFLAAKDEERPPLVKRLEQITEKVIVARPATTSSRFDKSTEHLEIPELPMSLRDFFSAERSLRGLKNALPGGSRALFESTLRHFCGKLEVAFDE